MWARVHKLDRVRALPNGGALIVIEDERTAAQVQRVPSLSTLIAIARVLSAHRALDAKFDGKGEVRYATSANLPSFLSEAITRAGAAVAERDEANTTRIPAQPAGTAALIDVAFSELAHHARGSIGIIDIATALRQLEQRRRSSPLDRDKQPELYWPAVLELAALAGEQSRARGGRWIDTRDLPLPFALKLADGAVARPTIVAQKIVEGGGAEETLTTDKPVAAKAAEKPPAEKPAAEKPAAEKPAAEKPAAEDKPAADEPATDVPAATDKTAG
jgi:cell division septation protein DedD